MAKFDASLDTQEVFLEKEYVCSNCKVRMSQIATFKFKCPSCNLMYDSAV